MVLVLVGLLLLNRNKRLDNVHLKETFFIISFHNELNSGITASISNAFCGRHDIGYFQHTQKCIYGSVFQINIILCNNSIAITCVNKAEFCLQRSPKLKLKSNNAYSNVHHLRNKL